MNRSTDAKYPGTTVASHRLVNFPFSPARVPFFYGWVMVGGTVLAFLSSIPGQTVGVSVFVDSLESVLGLSAGELSFAYLLGTAFGGLLLPFAGEVLDRWGARTAVVVSALGMGVSLVGLAGVDRVLAWLAPGMHLAALAGVSVVFLFVRFFGQGCLTVVGRVAIGKWFHHRRGLAVGISSVFLAFGFHGSPRLLNALVEELGWRGASVLLAAVIGVGMALVGWVFFRDNPEECGLSMDGVDDPEWHRRKAAAAGDDTMRDFTRGEALRTAAFWVFSLGTATQSLLFTAVTFHITDIGAEMGLSRAGAFEVFLPMAFFSVPATCIGGWASDRVRLKWVLLVMMLAQAAGIGGIAFLDRPFGMPLLAVGFGVAGGLFPVLTTASFPRFFGRAHLGAISGLSACLLVLASAIGPLLFIEGARFLGSFRTVTLVCCAMPVAVILAALRTENPQHLHAARLAADGDQG